MHKFFYVYNPAGFRPRFRHETVESAINESRRLAKQNPGHEFQVLAYMGHSFKAPEPDAFKPAQDRPDDNIPF